jgi:hypothetical protein
MMLAFVIRRCAVELGHTPSPAEFAAWANSRGNGRQGRVFGRPITEREAAVILKHQSRLVSAQSARPEEVFVSADEIAPTIAENVVSMDAARRKQRRRPQR